MRGTCQKLRVEEKLAEREYETGSVTRPSISYNFFLLFVKVHTLHYIQYNNCIRQPIQSVVFGKNTLITIETLVELVIFVLGTLGLLLLYRYGDDGGEYATAAAMPLSPFKGQIRDPLTICCRESRSVPDFLALQTNKSPHTQGLRSAHSG